MSSIHVDSVLLEQTQILATAQGKSIEQFVEDALRQAVKTSAPQMRIRNGLPVMVVNGTMPAIDPNKVRESLEEDGF